MSVPAPRTRNPQIQQDTSTTTDETMFFLLVSKVVIAIFALAAHISTASAAAADLSTVREDRTIP